VSRLTFLLLILAIGLGVYIWFNPPARERTQAAWESARAYAVELYARVSPSIQNLFSGGDEAASNEASRSSADGSDGGGSTFNLSTIWKSVQSIWLNIAARFKAETS